MTTRHGGVSPPPYGTLNLGLHVGDQPGNVAENRARAAAAFGVGLGTMVFARQVHGAGAVLVGPEDCRARRRHARTTPSATPTSS